MRSMISSTHVTGRNYGKPQVLIITAPAPIADDQGFIIDETLEVEFIDTVRGITGYVQLLSLEIGTFSTGPSVMREYDAGRYTESRRRS